MTGQPHKEKAVIVADHVSFSYHETEVLSQISFSIAPNDFVALIGPNGSGKTTLVKLLLGLLQPQEGSIEVFGIPIHHFTDWDKIGYVPQHHAIDRQFPATVRELFSAKHQKNASELIKWMRIEELLDRQFVKLSGGQKQRVLIALSLLSQPKLLILDEPTVGVDVRSQQEFYTLLKRLNEEHKLTIILVTHDVGIVSAYVKSVLCLNKNVCCQGAPHQINKLLKQAYGSDFHILHHH